MKYGIILPIQSDDSIVGGITFAVHDTLGTSITVLGINDQCRYNSSGPFLIHLSQVMGAYEIDVNTNGTVSRLFKTYLACRIYLKDFYSSLGFQEVESLEEFKQGGQLESIGKHVELDMWIEYTGNDRQIIMQIPTLCYKMRNYISPTNYHFEIFYTIMIFLHPKKHIL